MPQVIQKAASIAFGAFSILGLVFPWFAFFGYGVKVGGDQGGVMEIADLGQFDDRVVLFGGPYSNAHALEALLAEAHGAQLICTGDVVAYCAEPRRCVQLIRDSHATVVAGNCEKQLGAGLSDCGCGFEVGGTCDLLARAWYAFAQAEMNEESRQWMAACPDVAVFMHKGQRYAVIHGGVTDIARFIWPTDPEDVFVEEWQALEDLVGSVDTIVAGHCGIGFQRNVRGKRWINAGVIGMPPNDGRQMTEYVVLADGQARFQRLHYDRLGAQQAMIAAGLTQGYHTALLTGYWASEDVLPASLRRSSALARG